MASVMAIVSKAVFEKQARGLGEGDVWPTDRYASKGKVLETLAGGGSLFLVTVRPPEELWLVGVLDDPEHDGDAWAATPNTTPIRAIGKSIDKLVLQHGNGLTFEKGKLAMSLQGPRVLADADVALLRGSRAKAAKTSSAKVATAAKPATASAAKPAKSAKTSIAKSPMASAARSSIAKSPRASAAKTSIAKAPAKTSIAKAPTPAPAKTSIAKTPTPAAKGARGGASVSLDRVYAALETKQPGAALELLLALWKTARSPVLAEAIDVLSTRVGGGVIEGDSPEALAKAWNRVAKAGDTADLELLLAQIRAGTGIDGVVDRIEKLEKRFPGDPRLASFVQTQLDQLAFTASSSSGVWDALFGVLDRIHDPRTAAVVAAARPRWDAKLAKRGGYRKKFLAAMDRVAELARAVVAPELSRDAIAPILELDRPVVTDDDRSLAALFDEVYRNPDDDHVRSVLADALVERDDPRGELIHLQLRTELSADEKRRAKELVGKHGRAWLGALGDFVSKSPKELVYERGFASRITIQKPDGKHPAYPIDAPEMATIETLEIGGSLNLDDQGLVDWIRRFPRVRRLDLGGTQRLARVVAGGPVPYAEILVSDPRQNAWFTRENFPKLERVILPWDWGTIEVHAGWKLEKRK